MKRILFGLLALAASASAFAIDGQSLINQSTVIATGGFPYQISQPGSYKLSGNLVVPPNTSAISINASDVSIDLNGFSIVSSLGGYYPLPIKGVDIASGIDTVTIRNGVFRNFGNPVASLGDLVTLDELTLINAPGFTSGISFGANTRITRVTGANFNVYVVCPSVVTESNFLNVQGSTSGCALVNNGLP